MQSELGKKGGETIEEQAKGIDKKPLNFDHERKSVSADVNYGIRFNTQEEALNFLESLSTEVYTRLTETGMRARCLTLKLLVRAKDAPVVSSVDAFIFQFSNLVVVRKPESFWVAVSVTV